MEEHKIPTLTLTPDLDAAQPAAKEPDLLQKAEAAPEAKNAISHRARAVEKLLKLLEGEDA